MHYLKLKQLARKAKKRGDTVAQRVFTLETRYHTVTLSVAH